MKPLEAMEELAGGLATIVLVVTQLAVASISLFGFIYWLYTAYLLGSWLMLGAALFPGTSPFTVLVGAWSMFFGVPDFVLKLFG
jgi:hypothetical protein